MGKGWIAPSLPTFSHSLRSSLGTISHSWPSDTGVASLSRLGKHCLGFTSLLLPTARLPSQPEQVRTVFG